MIKSVKQCITVQRNRAKKGKFGYSKAVREFVKQHCTTNEKTDWNDYRATLAALPVKWPETESDKVTDKICDEHLAETSKTNQEKSDNDN